MGALDITPPVMRRYEEMVSDQNKLPSRKTFVDTSTYLGAPVRRDLDFGGIKFEMIPGPDYVPIWELEVLMKKELMCTDNVPCLERIEMKIGNVRRHGTFLNCHEIVYFPMIYDRHPFPTELAKYLWSCRSTRAKPDMVYLVQLRKCFVSAIQKFKASQKKITINNLMINDSLYCLNWFNHQSKLQIIQILASSLRKQKQVVWLSAENTLLLLEDGLRLLLAISITCGVTLKALHLWHFFCDEALPLTTNEDTSLEDPLMYQRIDIDGRMINCMYFCFVMRGNYNIIPIMQNLVLSVAFYKLEHLEILSVEYRYLAGGQGESLLFLGCIRNGSLRELNILFTQHDYPEITKRYICHNAWKKAYKLCPYFRINFVAPDVKSFGFVIPALVLAMPLEGFYGSTGIKSDNAPILVNKIVFILINNFKKFLKKINLYLCRPMTPVSHLIAKLLTELPFLEEFTYRGPLENISSLHNILKYIEDNSLRIRKFEFFLTEDPCNPEPYIKAMSELHNQYEPMFIEKGIYFKLGTCQC